MKRYYIDNSAWFDSYSYNIPAIKVGIKKGGGKNIRTSLKFGWSNQPKVVTFSAPERNLEKIRKILQAELSAPVIIIHTKNW